MANKSRILIVEDNELNRKLLNDIIIALGHTPILAENGLSALAQMKKQIPDLVLLDILMPEMDGYEVLDHMKSDNKMRHIPVIVITAVDEMESAAKCISKGAEDYLVKPFNPILLKARINGSLEKKRLYDAEHELLQNTLNGIIKVLIDILSLANQASFNRAYRIRRYVRHIANKLNLDNTWQYDLASMLSQIGTVALHPDTLEKIYAGQNLTEDEKKMLTSHPELARDLLSYIPRFDKIAKMIALQQKPIADIVNNIEIGRWDNVILGGHILKVALDFDQLIYSGVSPEVAIPKMRNLPKIYNTAIVNTLKSIEDISIEMIVKSVKIQELKPGMVFYEDIVTSTDLRVATKGMEATRSSIEQIRHFVEWAKIKEPICVLVPNQ
jgi:response regulator RpfG family c-di-GMP phosphodiesterase